MKAFRKAILITVVGLLLTPFLFLPTLGADTITIKDDVSTSTEIQTKVYDNLGVDDETENIYTWFRIDSLDAMETLETLGKKDGGVPILLVATDMNASENYYLTSSGTYKDGKVTPKINKKLLSSAMDVSDTTAFVTGKDLHYVDSFTGTGVNEFMITRNVLPTFYLHSDSTSSYKTDNKLKATLETVDSTGKRGNYLGFDITRSKIKWFMDDKEYAMVGSLFPEMKSVTSDKAKTFSIHTVRYTYGNNYYMIYYDGSAYTAIRDFTLEEFAPGIKKYVPGTFGVLYCYPILGFSTNGLTLMAAAQGKDGGYDPTLDIAYWGGYVIMDPDKDNGNYATSSIALQYNLDPAYFGGTANCHDTYSFGYSIYVGLKGISTNTLRKSLDTKSTTNSKVYGRAYAYTEAELAAKGVTKDNPSSSADYYYVYNDVEEFTKAETKEITTLTYDLDIAGPTEATGSLNSTYTVSTGSVLYVPSDKKIVIEEGASLVVAGGSLLILHGEIENYGTLIVQSGGTIMNMQRTDNIKSAIYNIGGSVLIRDNAKVVVRRFVTGVSRGHYKLEAGVGKASDGTYSDFYKALDTKEKSKIYVYGVLFASHELVFNTGTESVCDGGFILFGDAVNKYYFDLVTRTEEEMGYDCAYSIGSSDTTSRYYGTDSISCINNGKVVVKTS